ncbi:hypothetical protein AN958_08180 [Leucoagaricus sp. SymC.cos]|nr:hypothetical protein AN958_08180 [Leucoagaricus sp. SymC.cos]
MHDDFAHLLPFVLAAIILGTFFPIGNRPPGRGMRPINAGGEVAGAPPGVVNHPGLRGLLVRCIAVLWDVIAMIYGLSTTLHRGESPLPHASTAYVDARNRLLSYIGVQGWTGLERISLDSLGMLGSLWGHTPSSPTQDALSYVQRFITYSLVDILSRRDNVVLSPGVLNDIATGFARTGYISAFNAPAFPTLQLDDDDINFIVRSILSIVNLVIMIIPLVENEPDVRAAFAHFADDPTSLIHYTTSLGNLPSVEEIVRLTHRPPARQASTRILTVARPRAPQAVGKLVSTTSIVLRSFNDPTLGGIPPPIIDVGPGTITPRDEEVEYLAALFIAALVCFHSGSTNNAVRHAN